MGREIFSGTNGDHPRDEGLPRRELESVQWPESMWPLDPGVLQSLPEELLPDIDTLRDLRYPWEFFTLMQATMKDRITETRGQETAQFDNPNSTTIQGPVWFGEGAKIRASSEIDGPAYIGGHIGFGTLVRDSLVLPGTFIGAHSEIARSLLLGEGASLPHQDIILDGIIGPGVNLAGGVRTANYLGGANIKVRVPGHEQPVDTGLDHFGTVMGRGSSVQDGAVFNPGKFLGRGSIVEQGVRVYSHVPDGMVLSAPRVEPVLKRINPR